MSNSNAMQFLHFDSANGNYDVDPFNVTFPISSGGIRNIKRM